MKEYELIWEIFNKCPRNQMRDVFVEELELEDPEEYISVAPLQKFDKCGIISFTLYGSAVSRKATDSV